MIGAAMQAAVDATALVGWEGPVTFIGLAALVVAAVIRGWLVPKSSHEREIQVIKDSNAATVQGMKDSSAAYVGVLETRIAELTEEKNEWRGTAQAAERVSAEVRRQNGDLLEVARTTAYALDEMRKGLATQSQKDVTPT